MKIKHIILFVSSIIFCHFADAQGVYKPIPEMRFANLDSNRIEFPGHPGSFDIFFKKLDNLIFRGKGQINIVHIGGSHVQADIISHRFRSNLLVMQPGLVSSRGLIFPFAVAKTNNPWNYKTTYKGKWTAVKNVQKDLKATLGLMGIAILTSDSTSEITIQLRNTELLDFRFKKITILCTGDSLGVVPVLRHLNFQMSHTSYDSINHAYIFELPAYADQFTIGFSGFRTSVQSIGITGIILEDDVPGIIYHSVGVNGASVPSYLKCENFERDLVLLKPDLVILAIGINDANSDKFTKETFYKNYVELIQKIRNVNPYCSLLFITNNDSYRKVNRKYYVNPNGPLAREVFFTLANEFHGGIWDLFTIMGGFESMKKWESAAMAKPDKVHFTSAGYTLLGDLLFNAFWKAYSEHIKTSIYSTSKVNQGK